MVKISKYPPREDWANIIARPHIDYSQLFDTVKNILDDVRQNGNRAVAAYSEQFDKAVLNHFAVTKDEMN